MSGSRRTQNKGYKEVRWAPSEGWYERQYLHGIATSVRYVALKVLSGISSPCTTSDTRETVANSSPVTL